MPLVKRAVEPVYISRTQLDKAIKNELEGVVVNTLSGLIKQLSSISKHAENLFGELFNEATSIYERSSKLNIRVSALHEKAALLDSTVKQQIAADDIFHHFKSVREEEQQILSRSTLPNALQEMYNSCDSPPPLSLFTPYRDDGRNGMSFYTNPNYFYELWVKDQNRLIEKKKKRERRRREKKKDRPKKEIKAIKKKVYHNVDKEFQDENTLPSEPSKRPSMIMEKEDEDYRPPGPPPAPAPAPPSEDPYYSTPVVPPPPPPPPGPPNPSQMAAVPPPPPPPPPPGSDPSAFQPPTVVPQVPAVTNANLVLNNAQQQPSPHPSPHISELGRRMTGGISILPQAPPSPAMGYAMPNVPAPPPPPPPSIPHNVPPPPPPSLPQNNYPPPPPPPSTTVVEAPKEQPDQRSALLRAIEEGKKLRRVERTDKKTPGTSVGNDVASILKRRIAMELSSSESDSSGSDESDSDWSD